MNDLHGRLEGNLMGLWLLMMVIVLLLLSLLLLLRSFDELQFNEIVHILFIFVFERLLVLHLLGHLLHVAGIGFDHLPSFIVRIRLQTNSVRCCY